MERGPSKEGASGRPMDERGYLASQPARAADRGGVGGDPKSCRGEREVRGRPGRRSHRRAERARCAGTDRLDGRRPWMGARAAELDLLRPHQLPQPPRGGGRRPEPRRSPATSRRPPGPRDGLRVVSRSDSTLRGHYPAETDALARGACGGRTRAGRPDHLSGFLPKPAGSRWTTSTGCVTTGSWSRRDKRSSPPTTASASTPRTSRRGSRRKPVGASTPTRS